MKIQGQQHIKIVKSVPTSNFAWRTRTRLSKTLLTDRKFSVIVLQKHNPRKIFRSPATFVM